MAIEQGHAFIVVHADMSDVDSCPRVEISGMSVYSAQNILHKAANALWNRLNDPDVIITGPDGDTLIVSSE